MRFWIKPRASWTQDLSQLREPITTSPKQLSSHVTIIFILIIIITITIIIINMININITIIIGIIIIVVVIVRNNWLQKGGLNGAWTQFAINRNHQPRQKYITTDKAILYWFTLISWATSSSPLNKLFKRFHY